MKKIIGIAVAIILMSGMAMAQVASGSGTGTQQPAQAGTAAGQVSMRDLHDMMRQLTEVMKKLTRHLEHKNAGEYSQLMNMSFMMNQMSHMMRNIADLLALGLSDPGRMPMLQEQMKNLNEAVARMEKMDRQQ